MLIRGTGRLPFGFSTRHPARCVRCGQKTFRRVTRDLGYCKPCEDATMERPARETSGIAAEMREVMDAVRLL